ncbi:MAG: hypothetical protein ACLGSA_14370 [Acidobacteriota bacterium]
MRKNLWNITGILMACLVAAVLFAPRTIHAQSEISPQTPPSIPSGTVSLTIGQGGLLLSASAGSGTLVFKNRKYAFELGGIGLGQFGGSKATCVGEVYNLTRLEDFSGAYVQLKTGVTGTDGHGEIWLKNTNGVELRLRSKTKGFELTASAEGVLIKLKEGKKKKP